MVALGRSKAMCPGTHATLQNAPIGALCVRYMSSLIGAQSLEPWGPVSSIRTGRAAEGWWKSLETSVPGPERDQYGAWVTLAAGFRACPLSVALACLVCPVIDRAAQLR